MLQVACYAVTFLLCLVVQAKARALGVRQAVLLIASLGLYLTWTPWFAAILLASAVTNFLAGAWLRKNPSWLPLSAGVLFNLALLSLFKYVPELASVSPFARIALPLGISFWTFQALSYLFDLYRGEELDPSFAEFLLYMSFFPVTVSGPVCRLPDMLPQFRAETPTSWDDIGRGLRRIGTGVLMIQLAKLLGRGIVGGDGIVSGFDHATQWSGADVWCLAFGYGLQLFLDFAGYTHIAVGSAKALGLTLPENFDHPFESTSPSAFWTRWHMSLSFWIRDYVFLPLAMLRRELWWRHLALILSMVLFGLWHKASLLFLVWGGYHGVLLVLHRLVLQVERRYNWEPPPIWTPLSWLVTLSIVSLGWILFRAQSFSQAGQMLAAVASPASYTAHFLSTSLYLLVATLAVGYALVVLVSRWLESYAEAKPSASGTLAALARHRWFWILPLYAVLLLFVLMITLTQDGGTAQFLYRRF